MKKACIFDLDGTLTNTINAIAHFGNLALRTYGFKEYPTDRYKKFVGDGRTKLIERMLENQDALTPDNYEKVCAKYDLEYEADPLYDTDAYDGIREVIAELKKRGVKIAVCSNKPDNVAHNVIGTVFGENVFDCVRGVKEGGKTKPDPESALDISEKIGVTPKECVFVGDTNVDIFTGKNAGMMTVGALWGFRDFDELSSAGAEHIIETPAELLKFF